MYNINILTECTDEAVRVAIISAVLELLGGGESSINVSRMRHGTVNSPVWNMIGRRENLNNMF